MSSVLVRSYDRFNPFANDIFKLAFQDAWDELQQLISQDNQLQIEHIQEWDNYESKKIEACFYKKHILKVSCGLPEGSNSRETLFRALIDSNIAAAVWTRTCDIEDCECLATSLDCFIESESLKNSSVLLSQLKEIRNQAWMTSNGKGLGDHLAVLMDNPYRLPIHLQSNDF